MDAEIQGTQRLRARGPFRRPDPRLLPGGEGEDRRRDGHVLREGQAAPGAQQAFAVRPENVRLRPRGLESSGLDLFRGILAKLSLLRGSRRVDTRRVSLYRPAQGAGTENSWTAFEAARRSESTSAGAIRWGIPWWTAFAGIAITKTRFRPS